MTGVAPLLLYRDCIVDTARKFYSPVGPLCDDQRLSASSNLQPRYRMNLQNVGRTMFGASAATGVVLLDVMGIKKQLSYYLHWDRIALTGENTRRKTVKCFANVGNTALEFGVVFDLTRVRHLYYQAMCRSLSINNANFKMIIAVLLTPSPIEKTFHADH